VGSDRCVTNNDIRQDFIQLESEIAEADYFSY